MLNGDLLCVPLLLTLLIVEMDSFLSDSMPLCGSLLLEVHMMVILPNIANMCLIHGVLNICRLYFCECSG